MEEIENNKPSLITEDFDLIIEDLENLRTLLRKKHDEIGDFLTSFLIEGYNKVNYRDKFIENIVNIKCCYIHIEFYIKEIIEKTEELNKIEHIHIKNSMLYPDIKKFIWNLSRKIKEL